MKLDRAVAGLAPAVIGAAAEPEPSVAVVGGFGCERVLFHARDRVDDLERRAGRVDALDDAILQWMVRIRHQLVPICSLDAAAEDIGIERRVARHREDVAVVGIERHQRAHLALHRLFRRLLHVEVQRQHDALARLVGDLLQHAQPASDRIDLDLLTTSLAAQERFPSALEAELPDLIAHLVAGLHEVVAINFADVPQQMSRERAVQIMARRGDFEADAREIELMRFQRDDLRPFEALVDGDRLVLGPTFVICRIELVLDAGLSEQILQAGDGLIEVRRILRNEDRIEGWARIDQRAMAAIENQSARRSYASKPDAIAIGQLDKLGILNDLKVVEPDADQTEHRHHHRGNDDDAKFQLWNLAIFLLAARVRHERY